MIRKAKTSMYACLHYLQLHAIHTLYPHRPQLGEKGGGRLLQKALLGLGRKRPSNETEEDVHVPKVKGTVCDYVHRHVAA